MHQCPVQTPNEASGINAHRTVVDSPYVDEARSQRDFRTFAKLTFELLDIFGISRGEFGADGTDFRPLAKAVFKLFDLLEITTGDATRDSIMIKMNSAEVKECLQTCRMLHPQGHPGQELPVSPSLQQLQQYLKDIMSILISSRFTHVHQSKEPKNK